MMIHRGVETSENVIQILLETEMGFESSSGVRESRIHDGVELDRFKQWEKPWSLKVRNWKSSSPGTGTVSPKNANAGFLSEVPKMGVPPHPIYFRNLHDKPSSYGGTPHHGNGSPSKSVSWLARSLLAVLPWTPGAPGSAGGFPCGIQIDHMEYIYIYCNTMYFIIDIYIFYYIYRYAYIDGMVLFTWHMRVCEKCWRTVWTHQYFSGL